jgi:hypothetical protein
MDRSGYSCDRIEQIASPSRPLPSQRRRWRSGIAWACALLIALLPAVLVAGEAGPVNSAKSGIGFETMHAGKTGFISLDSIASASRAGLPPQVVAADSYGGDDVDFVGAVHLAISGGTASISINEILNSSTTYYTGSLRIDLWALQAPYHGGSFTGYQTASIRTIQINGAGDSLSPGQYFYNISLNLPYTAPGDASYNQYVIMVLEYIPDTSRCTTSDHYCVIAALNLSGNAPVCSPYASPASLPSSGGTVTLYSSCTNSPSSYAWVNSGNTLSYDANFSTTLPPNNGTGPATYVFTVTASNGSGSDSESVSVQVAAGSGGVSAPSPDFSPCIRNTTTACLLNGRFRVQANWGASPSNGGPVSVTYFGGGRAETDNAAVLYFQSASFFEIGVTLYDGCSYGGIPYTWVFIGGLTDFSWAMTISDTEHGVANQYSNPYHAVTQTTTDYYSGFSCN